MNQRCGFRLPNLRFVLNLKICRIFICRKRHFCAKTKKLKSDHFHHFIFFDNRLIFAGNKLWRQNGTALHQIRFLFLKKGLLWVSWVWKDSCKTEKRKKERVQGAIQRERQTETEEREKEENREWETDRQLLQDSWNRPYVIL